MSDIYDIDGEKLRYEPERVADWLRGRPIYPLYIEVSPVQGCGHQCVFCGVDVFLGDTVRTMDADVLTQRLVEMGQLGVKAICYAGEGEPTLHPKLGQIISSVKAKIPELKHAITTNGTGLTERVSRDVLPASAWIKFSINGGTPAVYAAIHRAPERHWDIVWRNIERAVRMRKELNSTCTLGAQVVLLPENAETLQALGERCREMGLDLLVVKPYSQQTFSETRIYEGLAYEQFAPVLDRIESLNTENFHVIVRRAAMRAVIDPHPYERCLSVPNFWAYVTPRFDLFSCSAHLDDMRFRLGNLRDHSFEEVWNGDQRRSNLTLMKSFDISGCRRGCRATAMNRFLDRVTHPRGHDGYV